MISTRQFGSAIFDSMQARAGRFFPSVQAFHASFMSGRLRMSLTQIVAVSTLDLSEPHSARRRSMFARICCGLAFRVLRLVVGGNAREIGRVAVLDGTAEDAFGFVADDCAHLCVSCLIGGKKLQPTLRRQLRNMRIQGESSFALSGAHDICTDRNTRSGCGITTVKRPSAVVRPVMPCGEPFAFCG